MKAVQKGFTLIELMIVVAIIGILAAIAIPAYQDYTIRSQVTEGLNLAAAVKAEVSEYYAQYGRWPTAIVGGAGTLGHTANQVPSGKYVDAVKIAAGDGGVGAGGGGPGTIYISFSNTAPFVANSKLNGKFLALRPVLSGADDTGNEDVIWLCGQNPGSGQNHQPTGSPASAVATTTTVDNKYLPANCRP
jgi:type IV pilus assembly protein PilA